jgi:predicted NBD/HSP70 family sugar kinase
MAERAVGVAQGTDDFVLMWIGVGLGLATIIGGRVHRGVAGAAGESGYLPEPGVPPGRPCTGTRCAATKGGRSGYQGRYSGPQGFRPGGVTGLGSP